MKKFLSVISFMAAITISVAAFASNLSSPHAFILQEVCVKCGTCVGTCPFGAIYVDNDTYQINPYACSACGTCMDACPVAAIWIVEYGR